MANLNVGEAIAILDKGGKVSPVSSNNTYFMVSKGKLLWIHLSADMQSERVKDCGISSDLPDTYYREVYTQGDLKPEHFKMGTVHLRSGRGPIKAIKIGRNQPCPCGSGKKYKQCHLGS